MKNILKNLIPEEKTYKTYRVGYDQYQSILMLLDNYIKELKNKMTPIPHCAGIEIDETVKNSLINISKQYNKMVDK